MCGGNQLGACMAYIGLAAATPALSSLTGIDMRGMWIYLPVALQWQMRNKIRQKYGIKVRTAVPDHTRSAVSARHGKRDCSADREL